MSDRRLIAAAAAALIALSACAPTYTSHGFTPQVAELDQIQPGADTRGSVLRKLGQPSARGSFDGDVWYYIASRMEHFAFYAPQVVDRTVVAVRFDENGLVTDVSRFGLEDGTQVALVTDTTRTYGRELTVLQQVFGNIGQINPADLLGQDP